MSYLQYLKRNKIHYSTRWIVKYDDNEPALIREVKQIFNPEEYRECKRPRTLNTKVGLIKILEDDKERRRKNKS